MSGFTCCIINPKTNDLRLFLYLGEFSKKGLITILVISKVPPRKEQNISHHKFMGMFLRDKSPVNGSTWVPLFFQC